MTLALVFVGGFAAGLVTGIWMLYSDGKVK